MSKDIKNYHVETQEDYDDLLVNLEERGYRWRSGDLPTDEEDFWTDYEGNTCVQTHEYDKSLTYGSVRNVGCGEIVIKHKAKGVEQMEKVVVPQFVADWFENVSEKELDGNDVFRIIQDILIVGNGLSTWNDYDVDEKLVSWVEENEETFLNLIVNCTKGNGYEVEEKKYYWRKKKDCYLDFEYKPSSNYINLYADEGVISFDDKEECYPYITKFSESEIIDLLGEEDFKKLERVEIDE